MPNCQRWLLKKFNEKQNKQTKCSLQNYSWRIVITYKNEICNLQNSQIFVVKNIVSYPNYQILFLSTDEIVKKISIITNVNQFFSLRKLFSQSKFPNFCWQNTKSYPYYQILSLSTDEIVKKESIITHVNKYLLWILFSQN